MALSIEDYAVIGDCETAALTKFRSISGIACVPKIILGLASGEITRERSDPAAQARELSAPPSYADRP